VRHGIGPEREDFWIKTIFIRVALLKNAEEKTLSLLLSDCVHIFLFLYQWFTKQTTPNKD